MRPVHSDLPLERINHQFPMTSPLPEPWLRGPVPDVPPLLQPAAHAFLMAGEDVEEAVAGLTSDQAWHRPLGITPIGFHLLHVAGSTSRLLTYARGESLSAEQRAALVAERNASDVGPSLELLRTGWQQAVADAIRELQGTPESVLLQPRTVGRAQLPSTVIGLLFHAAEHASRHTGQIVTTAKLVRSLTASDDTSARVAG
ncbi:MAG: hypothetical protein MNPFHGCM_03015 [Gemmatimonadaceae bacterium]|nr:hypothetical protein [Gemmatimonadaceae bacterium]